MLRRLLLLAVTLLITVGGCSQAGDSAVTETATTVTTAMGVATRASPITSGRSKRTVQLGRPTLQ